MSGEAAMMAEIYGRGPIACGVAVTDDFLAYSGGIFNDTTNAKVRKYTIHSCNLIAAHSRR